MSTSGARVAIVTPCHRETLTDDERTSLRHLEHFLGTYDRFVIAPEGLQCPIRGVPVRRFARHFFIGLRSYSELLLSREFYETWRGYDYMLIYQLDALVFSSDLESWCRRDFDYIGAPWWSSWTKQPSLGDRLHAVGNGGLSLRKVDAFLAVLSARTWPFASQTDRKQWIAANGGRKTLRCFPHLVASAFRLASTITQYAANHPDYAGNEDAFWAFAATRFKPGFSIAPIQDALQFSFEVAPRRCFEKNNRQMPFGCHAWPRYDREFWEPHLLR